MVTDHVAVGRVQTKCDEVAGFELVFRNGDGGGGGRMGRHKWWRVRDRLGGCRATEEGCGRVKSGANGSAGGADGLRRVEWVAMG